MDKSTRSQSPVVLSEGGADAAGAPQIFRREGEYWTIVYAGTTIRLHDAIGLHRTIWRGSLETAIGQPVRQRGETGRRKGYDDWSFSERLRLRAGDEVEAKVLMKARGASPPLDLSLPVTVQLVNSANVCFEGVYDPADVIRNNARRFNALAR